MVYKNTGPTPGPNNKQLARSHLWIIVSRPFVSQLPTQSPSAATTLGSIPKPGPVNYPDQWLYMQAARRPMAPLLRGPGTGARPSSTQWTAADDARPLPTRSRAFAASHRPAAQPPSLRLR